ncbi:MAG: hypothetical protein ACM3MB_03370 [Acidobacteriota bacterium]
MAEVMAKGVNFLYAKRFIGANYGTEKWEKIMRSLSRGDQYVWSEGILVTRSYPFSAFKAMIVSLSKELGTVRNDELARIYGYIADQSLNKVYKIFFRFANPSFVIKNYPKLWDNFFDTGKVGVPVAEKGRAVLTFLLPEIFIDWIPPACLGYSKKAIEMSGGKDMTMKELGKKHMGAGQWEISYELLWSE